MRPGLVIAAAELSWQVSQASGPGGQHVNKTSSRVSLRWSVIESAALSDFQRQRLLRKLASKLSGEGELAVHVQDSRSQLKNRELARERLAECVREALHVPKARRATKPTRGSKRRRVEGKKRRADTKRMRKRPGRED